MIGTDMSSAETTNGAPLAKEDLGLGTAYERVAIYKLFDRWSEGRRIDSAAEGPLDGMAGIPGLHLMGFAHRGINATVCLPDDDALARVRALYRRQGIEDRLSTYRIAADAIPTGPVDVLVSYNALPYVNDWRGYLKRLLSAEARWFFVVISNPVSYGTYLRRAQRKLRGEDVVELFDHEATRRSAIEPELERHGRILSHDYLDCPWWPDFVLPARKNLAGDTLAKVKGLFGRSPLPESDARRARPRASSSAKRAIRSSRGKKGTRTSRARCARIPCSTARPSRSRGSLGTCTGISSSGARRGRNPRPANLCGVLGTGLPARHHLRRQ